MNSQNNCQTNLNIKSLFILVLLSLFITSCGGDTKEANPVEELQKKLVELNKKKADIENSITKIQNTLDSISDPESNRKKDLRLVEGLAVIPQIFKHYIEILGRVDDNNVLTVFPEGAPGVVKKIFVRPGQRVKRGDILLQLEDTIINSQIRTLEEQIDFLQNIYNKQKRLWDDSIGSELQYLTAKNNLSSALNNLVSLKANKDFTTIRAEANAVVNEINVEVGEMFFGTSRQGAQMVLKTNNKTKIIAPIPDNYYDKVKVGFPTLVALPNSNKYIISKVKSVSNFIDVNSRTFNIEIDLSSKPNKFFANQTLLIKILDYTNTNSFIVPINLLRNDLQGTYVYVSEKNEQGFDLAKKKYISTGLINNKGVEITKGLEKGDIIITKGYEDLYQDLEINLQLNTSQE